MSLIAGFDPERHRAAVRCETCRQVELFDKDRADQGLGCIDLWMAHHSDEKHPPETPSYSVYI